MERLGAQSGSSCMWLCADGSHFQDVAAFFTAGLSDPGHTYSSPLPSLPPYLVALS